MINAKTSMAFVINKSKIRTGFRKDSTSDVVLCSIKPAINVTAILIVNKQAKTRSTTIV